MLCGVIGNTPDFESGILGSSPSEAVRKNSYFLYQKPLLTQRYYALVTELEYVLDLKSRFCGYSLQERSREQIPPWALASLVFLVVLRQSDSNNYLD
jgi:hypothetical protein